MKRAVTLAAKGLAALETLLTGAKKVPTVSKSYRLYKKKGSLETALNDFNSVEPVLTNQHANRPKLGGRGRSRKPLMGTVGDRRLILMPDGDGFSRHSPVLEIRSATDALHDRIVYKMEK